MAGTLILPATESSDARSAAFTQTTTRPTELFDGALTENRRSFAGAFTPVAEVGARGLKCKR
jgi:hypothetical protein